MGKPIIGPVSLPDQKFDDSGIEDSGTSGTLSLPADAKGVLIVEGNTDEQYLRIACDAAGQSGLLEGVHVVACNGVNGVVQQTVLFKAQFGGLLPIVALLDKDANGKAARESLITRFGMPKSHVITYGELFAGNPDEIEAEDLFPSKLLQRFIEQFGEDNVLSEKKMHPQLKKWHYGFNATGKDVVAQYLSENIEPADASLFVNLAELIRTRLGLGAPPATPSSLKIVPITIADTDETDEGDYEFEERDEVDDEIDIDQEMPPDNESVSGLYSQLRERVLRLGDDVKEHQQKHYVGFARGRLFLAVATRQKGLKLYVAVGPNFDDPNSVVHKRDVAATHPNNVFSYFTTIEDASQIGTAMDIVTQAYATVGPGGEWLEDGKAWHLETRCHAQGREIVNRLVELIGNAVPDSGEPDWSQKNYVAWSKNGRNSG